MKKTIKRFFALLAASVMAVTALAMPVGAEEVSNSPESTSSSSETAVKRLGESKWGRIKHVYSFGSVSVGETGVCAVLTSTELAHLVLQVTITYSYEGETYIITERSYNGGTYLSLGLSVPEVENPSGIVIEQVAVRYEMCYGTGRWMDSSYI